MRILLVEDNSDHAALVQRCLDRGPHSHQVDTMRDGQQALEHLSRCLTSDISALPDLILLDLNLPRVTGHEVLASVKSNERLQHIPIVVLTTSDSDVDRAKACALHANSYLIKSPDFEELNEMLDDVQRYWSRWDQCGPAPGGRGTQASTS